MNYFKLVLVKMACIGHSSRLYLSCAFPQLLYGSEVMHIPETLLKTIETSLNKAARIILGKKGDSNVIWEALRGDLGWLSIESHFNMSKLNFLVTFVGAPIVDYLNRFS